MKKEVRGITFEEYTRLVAAEKLLDEIKEAKQVLFLDRKEFIITGRGNGFSAGYSTITTDIHLNGDAKEKAIVEAKKESEYYMALSDKLREIVDRLSKIENSVAKLPLFIRKIFKL